MTISGLTINPDEVRRSAQPHGELPEWLEHVAAYVERAASAGETVTLTAKPLMLTPEQVADELGISRSTVSRKIKDGEIRAVKVGNRNRIPYEEYERFRLRHLGDLVEFTRSDIESDLFG